MQEDPMTVFEAWLLGGPVDGRVMAIETTLDGQPPDVVKLPQSGVYVGSSDAPAPLVEHVYMRVGEWEGYVIYEYRGI